MGEAPIVAAAASGPSEGVLLRTAVVCATVRLYREGLAKALEASGLLHVLGTASEPHEALRLAAALEPDVVLLDVSTYATSELERRLATVAATQVVVAVGVPEQEEHVIACAQSGVAGFVTHEMSLAELVDGVEAAVHGDVLCTPEFAGVLMRRVRSLAASRSPSPTAVLTSREAQILDLVAGGLSNKEIAARLRIEPSTVKNHVHSILGKLNVRRRSDAAVVRALAD